MNAGNRSDLCMQGVDMSFDAKLIEEFFLSVCSIRYIKF